MSRADRLQSAHIRFKGSLEWLNVSLQEEHAAIPDLLAVVRMAQQATSDPNLRGSDGTRDRRIRALDAALAAFEEGG